MSWNKLLPNGLTKYFNIGIEESVCLGYRYRDYNKVREGAHTHEVYLLCIMISWGTI
jgi:hypothetical protein